MTATSFWKSGPTVGGVNGFPVRRARGLDDLRWDFFVGMRKLDYGERGRFTRRRSREWPI